MTNKFAFVAAAAALVVAGCSPPKADPVKVQPSVLHVAALHTVDSNTTGISLGTAFVVADGYLVTNNHVVDGGERFALFGSGLKDPVTVRVVARSSTLDLALLHAGSDLKRPALVLDISPPPVGSEVYAMGYPGANDEVSGSEKGAEDASVTNGNLSRTIMGSWNGTYQFPMLQHTAPINHGNSGGPLMDACNHVVGVNTAGAVSKVNIGVDANKNLTLDADIVAGVYQASGASELDKYLEEQNVHVKVVKQSCGAPMKPATMAVAAVGVVGLIVVGGAGYVAYRRRKPAAAASSKAATGVAAGNLPPRGLRLLGAGGGGALNIDVPPERFANTLGAVTVGRNPQLVDIVIQSGHPADKAADETISRAHARILWKGDAFYIEDYGRSGEGSSNKTFLNGEELPPASPRKIRAGDRVRFGKHEFQIFDL